MPDHRPLYVTEVIAAKSRIMHPGIDPPPPRPPGAGAIPHLVWAARWEHDKDPETFFAAIDRLLDRNAEFQLSVLGESYGESPEVFERAHKRLGDRVRHWGYLEDAGEYRRTLATADIFVSTARHEFFGLTAVEAMAAGASPLLPHRLSYPELVELDTQPANIRHLYNGTSIELADRIEALLGEPSPPTLSMERFYWDRIAAVLDDGLEQVAAGTGG